MEYVQPWAQPRQGYPQGNGFRQNQPGGAQRTPYPGTASQQGPSPLPGTGALTRTERQEAKRLVEEANFSYNGYQVVRREFISHPRQQYHLQQFLHQQAGRRHIHPVPDQSHRVQTGYPAL